MDEEGFAYSVRHFELPVAASNDKSDTQEATYLSSEDTSTILDTGRTKAMRSRTALQKMKAGLHSRNIETLPDVTTFNFANGGQALAKEKCRMAL